MSVGVVVVVEGKVRAGRGDSINSWRVTTNTNTNTSK